jgi:hypothetical protein
MASFSFAISLHGDFRMPLCDGCGAQVDEAHIRTRIERLERATRFRPIHIQVLFLAAAPPPQPEDDFYRATTATKRSAACQIFFDQITQSIGRKPGDAADEQATLAEFQRAGFYLAYAVECPIEAPEQLAATVTKLARRVLLRVNTSYKPKFVAPLSHALLPLIAMFQNNSWADRLILRDGAAFEAPTNGDPPQHAEFGAALANRVSKAVAHHS